MGLDQVHHEKLDTENVTIHLISGAIAGYAEYIIMYPIDTVKTRMQSISFKGTRNIFGVLLKMIAEEGILSPIRGLTVVVAASGPAHALYYGSYEFVKINLQHVVKNHNSFCHGVAGCFATFFHDAVVNPSEVIKQRMQMEKSTCHSVIQCTKEIYRIEGVQAFYRSFATTLLMNIPFQSIHFIVYELCQDYLNKERDYDPKSHIISGGLAGGVGAAITNPLDVCRTLINTQESKEAVGLVKAVKIVYKKTGFRGFLSGVTARTLHLMPSTAICWSTYEFCKYLLKEQKHKDSDINK